MAIYITSGRREKCESGEGEYETGVASYRQRAFIDWFNLNAKLLVDSRFCHREAIQRCTTQTRDHRKRKKETLLQSQIFARTIKIKIGISSMEAYGNN